MRLALTWLNVSMVDHHILPSCTPVTDIASSDLDGLGHAVLWAGWNEGLGELAVERPGPLCSSTARCPNQSLQRAFQGRALGVSYHGSCSKSPACYGFVDDIVPPLKSWPQIDTSVAVEEAKR